MAQDMGRQRKLWPANVVAVPLVFTGITLWDGLGYTFGPHRWASSPSLSVFERWPGGIRTYGALCLIVAVLLLAGLISHDRRTVRIGLTGCVVVYTALTLSVLGSWWMHGILAWGGPSKGAGLALLAVMILRRTPESGRE